jgi:pyrroloquinoline quinone biosynthesis protein D
MKQERPQLSPGFRLQWEPAQNTHVLLYPEGMIKLNQSAHAILSRCDGAHSLPELVEEVELAFAKHGLMRDVEEFIELGMNNGWLCNRK